MSRSLLQVSQTGVSVAAVAFFGKCVEMMLPWVVAMFAVIVADLVAGVWKSLRLGVHVSVSTALRNTMGKMVGYFSFVCTASIVDVAAEGSAVIARWCCLLVCAIEGLSIIGNFLKPHGIDLSLRGMLMLFGSKVVKTASEDMGEVVKTESVDKIKEREEVKWNRKR